MSGASGWRDDAGRAYGDLELESFRAIRRGWALVRWVAMVIGIGIAVAAAVAIAVAALATLLEESV
jgi:hypothetical protein